jgi:beta-lactamase regulating signal transducer with metallopeptidase domain
MNALVECINFWGGKFIQFAWPMLLQSSLLIVLLLALTWALERRVRASVQYAFLMIIIVKLVLPPSLALPTGIGYWVSPIAQKSTSEPQKNSAGIVARLNQNDSGFSAKPATESASTQKPKFTWSEFAGLTWILGMLGFGGYMLRRSRHVGQLVREAEPASEVLHQVLHSCCEQLGIRRNIQLKIIQEPASPALCGFWRPVILVPNLLVHQLSVMQLKSVLLHELGHYRRGDLWVNHLQALLQIFYWYNPLLWLANGVIRRVREQAVDELVMVHLRQESHIYPATLLEIAKFTLLRTSSRLSFVGIAESRSGLAARIRCLVTQPAPKTSKVGLMGMSFVFALSAIGLPMANGKSPSNSHGEVTQVAQSSGTEPEPARAGSGRGLSPRSAEPLDLTSLKRLDDSGTVSPSASFPTPRLEDPTSWLAKPNGCLIEQSGSKISISGINNVDGWGHGNGIATTRKLPEGDFYAYVDFMVPAFKETAGMGAGNALIYLRARSSAGNGQMVAILYQPNAGTYQVQGWGIQGAANTFSQPSVRKIGDEDRVFHRLKLKYDASAKIAAGWVDDKFIGALNYTMSGDVYFELLANTDKKGMQIDLLFNNLSMFPNLSDSPPTPELQKRTEPATSSRPLLSGPITPTPMTGPDGRVIYEIDSASGTNNRILPDPSHPILLRPSGGAFPSARN